MELGVKDRSEELDNVRPGTPGRRRGDSRTDEGLNDLAKLAMVVDRYHECRLSKRSANRQMKKTPRPLRCSQRLA